jgi:hypothetical protein
MVAGVARPYEVAPGRPGRDEPGAEEPEDVEL